MAVPVSISRVSKTFPAGSGGRGSPPTRALDNVSLEIAPGALCFLLGPSGCGKTTLLRILAGFLAPDAARSGSDGESAGATIRFGERDVTRLSPDRRGCAMVFQNGALWPHMTALENVEFVLRARGVRRDERKRRAAEALDLVRMGSFARRRPAALSGGEQQRIALARALAVRPEVLLLDEPLSNLDEALRRELRVEMQRLIRASGSTAIWVTHDSQEARELADQVCVMAAGRAQPDAQRRS